MPVAIITGASEGFGRALAMDLARDGWELVVDARRPGPLAETTAALTALGAEVHALPGDVGQADHRDQLVAVAEALGRLDLLVNNASTLGPTPLPHLDQYPLDELEQVFHTNVVAPMALIQRALPLLRASGGTIVNVTSDAAVEGYEGWGGYGSSKAALEQLSNVLAAEEPVVRVYRLDPGDMRTRMHQDAFPGDDISDRPEPEAIIPAVRRLLWDAPPSGRYRAADVGAVA
jgi:NAD(P)-dependent dehydrogenase (short-subunit alcohol dehydrogenase family)